MVSLAQTHIKKRNPSWKVATQRMINETMVKKEKTEWLRTLFHILTGLTIVSIYGLTNISRELSLIILGAVALFFLLGDLFRQFIPRVNRLTEKIFKGIIRQEEKRKMASTTYYVIGCWIAILIFPRLIASIAVLLLVVGDTSAKIIRQAKGRYFTLEAISGNFIICFLLAWLIFRVAEIPNAIVLSSLGALGASAAEMIPKIDNLAIPILSGALMSIGFYLIH